MNAKTRREVLRLLTALRRHRDIALKAYILYSRCGGTTTGSRAYSRFENNLDKANEIHHRIFTIIGQDEHLEIWRD